MSRGTDGGRASREQSWENPALGGKVRACRAYVKAFTMGGVVPEHCGLYATAASLRTMFVL